MTRGHCLNTLLQEWETRSLLEDVETRTENEQGMRLVTVIVRQSKVKAE
jgi:hypothetical protein